MDEVHKESDKLEENNSQWASTTTDDKGICGFSNEESMESNSVHSDHDDADDGDGNSGKDNMPFGKFNLPSNVITEDETNCSKGLGIGSGDGLTRRERKNLRRRESIQCPTCGKTVNRGSMSKHAKTHTRVKKFQCEICGNGYDRQDYFLKHMTLHIDKKPFKCSVCGKAFNLARKLISHETIHTGLKPFICSICHTSFTESSALYKHMRGIHEGNKPYECSFCGKTYNESAKVKRHMRIHTGEKPFVCPICSRAFNDKSAMIKHVRTHQKNDAAAAAAATTSALATDTATVGSTANNSRNGDSVVNENSINQSTILAKLLTAPNGVDVKKEIESEESYGQTLPPIHSYYEEMQRAFLGDTDFSNDDDDNNNNDICDYKAGPCEESEADKDIYIRQEEMVRTENSISKKKSGVS